MKHSKNSILFLITCLLLSFSNSPKHKYDGVGLAVLQHNGISPDEWYELYDYMKIMSEKHDIPLDVLIGLFSRESAFFSSELAREANNVAGLKAIRGEWKGEVYNKIHTDVITGREVKEKCNFRKYPSKKACIRDFISFLKHPRYQTAWACGKYDTKCWLNSLNQNSYSTDPNWPKAIRILLRRDYEKLYGISPEAPVYKVKNSTH